MGIGCGGNWGEYVKYDIQEDTLLARSSSNICALFYWPNIDMTKIKRNACWRVRGERPLVNKFSPD